MTFTPGPWENRPFPADFRHGDWWIRGPATDDGTTDIATLVGHIRGQTETKANATLIASAPDLLAALEDIRTWLVAPDLSANTIAEKRALVRAAIAKATT